MKKNPQAMQVLIELETHYANLLSGVRALIAAEQGRAEMGESRTVPSTNGAFSSLTKADAAEQILQERGKAIRTQDLFDAMKVRGHPVASKMSLYNMLATNDRFKRKKRGMWSLSK